MKIAEINTKEHNRIKKKIHQKPRIITSQCINILWLGWQQEMMILVDYAIPQHTRANIWILKMYVAVWRTYTIWFWYNIFFSSSSCVWVGNFAVQNKKKYKTRKNTQMYKKKKNIQHFFPSIFLRIILRIYFYYIRHIKYDIIVFVDTPLWILHRSAFFLRSPSTPTFIRFYSIFFIQFCEL